MQLQNRPMRVGSQIRSQQAKLNRQLTDFEAHDFDTLASLAAPVNPIHVSYEKERWQNAPLKRDQRPHEKALIASYSHEHKLLVDSKMT